MGDVVAELVPGEKRVQESAMRSRPKFMRMTAKTGGRARRDRRISLFTEQRVNEVEARAGADSFRGGATYAHRPAHCGCRRGGLPIAPAMRRWAFWRGRITR